MSFADQMEAEGARVIEAGKLYRGQVAGRLLNTAHGFAPLESGHLKAGLVPFAETVPEAPAEGNYGGSEGAGAPPALLAQAVELSRRAPFAGPFGVASTVDHASFAEANDPHIAPAVAVAERTPPMGPGDGNLR